MPSRIHTAAHKLSVKGCSSGGAVWQCSTVETCSIQLPIQTEWERSAEAPKVTSSRAVSKLRSMPYASLDPQMSASNKDNP